jgi:hypothetical protein
MIKITPDTKPADVMIEGRPEVEIVGFGPRPIAFHCDGMGEFYVFAKRARGITGWNGGFENAERFGYDLRKAYLNNEIASTTLREDGLSQWGQLVPRIVLDVTKPITTKGGDDSYTHVGTFTPTDGSEPVLHLRNDRTLIVFEVLASTGRIRPGFGRGTLGEWVNAPEISKAGAVAKWGDNIINLDLTLTDGVLTGVEWIK